MNRVGWSSLVVVFALLFVVTPASAGEASWHEIPSLTPVSAGKVILERVKVEVAAVAAGEIKATSTYTLANATNRKATVRVAVPVSYAGTHPFHDTAVAIRADAEPQVFVGEAATPLGADALAPAAPIEGSDVTGRAFDVALDRYAAIEVKVQVTLPWSAIEPPSGMPKERGLSLSFAGLSAWRDGLEGVDVVVKGTPRLLGPATQGQPSGYTYDSRALRWSFAREGDEPLALPARLAVAVLADWDRRTFDGVYYARFEAVEDDYPWPRRFHYVRPVSAGADGKPVIRRAHVEEILKQLQEIELLILARNGKRFDDTFSQMRFQKESWYKPARSFSEDRIRPVEAWNLDYARCQARASRTVLSALEKMGAEEVGADERKARLLLVAFERCDKRFWSPKPRRKEAPRLQ